VARTYHHGDFPLDLVLEAKARTGRTVSVCIPARDEASTVGSVVRAVVQPFLVAHGGNGLVDEVIVIDDGSLDDTAGQARDAGARVVAGPGGAGGKGQAMAAALDAAAGEVVAFLDADVANTTPAFVSGLLGPLLTLDDVALVKGYYTRPLHGEPTGGGRVTELVARPVLELLFPERRAGSSRSWGSPTATASSSGCSSTRPGISAPTAWPRSTWASGSTATGRCTSCARRRSSCCGRPSSVRRHR